MLHVPQRFYSMIIGIDEMKRTEFRSGRVMKSARTISTLVTTQRVVLADSGHNAQVMQWGQFIAHELTQRVNSKVNGRSSHS